MATSPLQPTPPAAGGRSPPPSGAAADGTWLFGRWRLEPGCRLQGEGRARHLDPRACAVLACLLRRADDVVPRSTLIAEAWPGADTVFDSAVSKVMRRLRTALGDPTGQVLLTVYGEGYRLAVPATFLPGTRPAPPLPAAEGADVPAGAAATAPPAPRPPPAPPPLRAPRQAPSGWQLWLPWAIAIAATAAALAFAWLLLRTGAPG